MDSFNLIFLDALSRSHTVFLEENLSEQEISNFKNEINLTVDKVVMSLIKGKIDSIDNVQLNEISEEIETFVETWNNNYIESPEKFDAFQNFSEPIILEILRIVKAYLSITDLFKNTSNHYIFQKQNFIDTDKTELRELEAYCNLYILDYAISDNLEYFAKLRMLRNRKENYHPIYPFKHLNIFEFKLTFLEYKWLKRRKYNVKELQKRLGKTYTEKYVFDNKIVDISDSIMIGDRFYPAYEGWLEKIELHYFGKYAYTDFDAVVRPNDTYSLYKAVKVYKDISPDLVQLKRLHSLFVNIELTGFSQSFKDKNILYYYNNLFSKVTESLENTDEVEELFKEIKVLYKDFANNNFFLFYKYLRFKIRQAHLLIERKEFSKIELEKLQSVLTVCLNSFEWCKKSFNRIYDFDYSNSIVEIEGVQVFHASSFSLPLSIVENQQLLDDLKLSLQKLEYDIFHAKSSGIITEITEQVRGSDKRSIEVISIFTAVISFIVGTVASYQFIKSLIQGLLFMGVLGTILSLFVFMILLATRGRQFFLNKTRWKYFLVPYVTILIVLGVLFNYYDKNEAPLRVNTLNNRMDSLISIQKKQNARLQQKKLPLQKSKDSSFNSKTNDNRNYH